MGKKDKMVQVLTNGTEVLTTKEGWDKKECHGILVSIAGWKEGKAVHFPISLGIAKAAKEKIEGVYLGDFETENEKGDTGLMETYSGDVLREAALNALIKEYDLDVVKIAGSRSGAAKDLKAIKETVSGLDPAILEQIRVSNPAAYEQMTGKKADAEPEKASGTEEEVAEDEAESDSDDEEPDSKEED